jgi:hypothetical protein
MAKLDSATQEQVEEAAAWGDEPIGRLLPEGWYVASLMEVNDLGGETGRWDWVFTALRDYDMKTGEIGSPRAGRAWWTTTTTPESIGKLKSTFAAFDATVNTDTDELLDEEILIYLDQHISNKGKKKGEMVNGTSAIKALPNATARTAGPRI